MRSEAIRRTSAFTRCKGRVFNLSFCDTCVAYLSLVHWEEFHIFYLIFPFILRSLFDSPGTLIVPCLLVQLFGARITITLFT